MRTKLIFCVLFAALSLGSVAAAESERAAPRTMGNAVVRALYQPPLGDFVVELDQLIYGLFLTQTLDTTAAIDVNDLPIVSSYDDNPDGFYMVFLLP
jgi:hypothetical protein